MIIKIYKALFQNSQIVLKSLELFFYTLWQTILN